MINVLLEEIVAHRIIHFRQQKLPQKIDVPFGFCPSSTYKVRLMWSCCAHSHSWGMDDPEIMLSRMPDALHLEISGATKHLQTPLANGMLRLTPQNRIWSRDGKGNAKVRRRGFEVVPDFGGTAHAYCGDSLQTAIGDLLEWDRLPTIEAMQRAYIIKSRVRDTSGLVLVQPYSPALFRQGATPKNTRFFFL